MLNTLETDSAHEPQASAISHTNLHNMLLFPDAAMDHTNNTCMLTAIMTHGNEKLLSAWDQNFCTEELWTPFFSFSDENAFKTSNSLIGKPKLFFIQVCY